MNITELKQSWEEWKASPEHAIWPEIIEGFDELLEKAGTPDPQRLAALETENNTLSEVLANSFKALGYEGPDYTALPRAIEETMAQLRADENRLVNYWISHTKKAEKACAEMRELLTVIRHQVTDLPPKYTVWFASALSSTCGQGYVSAEEHNKMLESLRTRGDKAIDAVLELDEQHQKNIKEFERIRRLAREATVRIMSHCGPADSWKVNKSDNLKMAIIELCLILEGPFTTQDAMGLAKEMGISL